MIKSAPVRLLLIGLLCILAAHAGTAQTSSAPDWSSIKRTVTNLSLSIGGKSDSAISKEWILSHPQLMISSNAYPLVSYHLGWLRPDGIFMDLGAVHAAESEAVLKRLMQNIGSTKGCRIFISEVVVRSQGILAAADKQASLAFKLQD